MNRLIKVFACLLASVITAGFVLLAICHAVETKDSEGGECGDPDQSNPSGVLIDFIDLCKTADCQELMEQFPDQDFSEITEFEDEKRLDSYLVENVRNGKIRWYKSVIVSNETESNCSLREYVGKKRFKLGGDLAWWEQALGLTRDQMVCQAKEYIESHGGELAQERDQIIGNENLRTEIYGFKEGNFNVVLFLNFGTQSGEITRWLRASLSVDRYGAIEE